MNVIENRGYVDRRGQALVPTWLAFAVTGLMEDHFGDLVDYDFTAEMEAGLDRIADGDEPRERWLHDFYFGTGKDGSSAVAAAAKDPGHHLGILGLKRMVADQGEIDARAVNTIPLAGGVDVRVGRYGPYLEVPPATPGAEPRRASIPEDLPPDELTPAKAQELLEAAAKGPDVRELGHDPATGHLIVARDGRFGPYVSEVLPEGDEAAAETPAAEAGQTATGKTTGKAAKSKTTGKTTKSKAAKAPKPRSASLFKSMTLDSVTLEQALQLLSLPRVIGTKPDGGEEITAQNGRYGPYIKCGTDSRSLASEDELFTLTLEQALEILAQPKTRRGQARAAAAPLAQLGADPATGKPMVIKDGRFGPYITDGETNVTVPRGEEPAAITAERAAQLLADKRAKGPVKRRPGARNAPAKKAAPRKAAAKK
jgi:DNA topoisomerase-1